MEIQILLTEDPHTRMNHYLSQTLLGNEITVLISPSKNRFDDFGTKAVVEVHVFARGDVIHPSAKMLIRRRGAESVEPSASILLHQLLERHGQKSDQFITKELELTVALKDYEFLTALADRDAYRLVISKLGAGWTRSVLESIHDVGILTVYNPDVSDYRNLSRVAAFGQALLRADETFVAVWDLSNMLVQGRANSELDVDKVVSIESAIIEDDGRIDLAFGRGILGRNRLNVLIGENGVGKTRLLNELAESVAKDSVLSDSVFSSALFIPSPLDERPYELVEKLAGRLIVRSHPSSTNGVLLTPKLARLARSITHRFDQIPFDLPSANDLDLLQRAVEPFLNFDELYLPLHAEAQGTQISTVEIEGRLYGALNKHRNKSEGVRTEFFGRIDVTRSPAFIKNCEIRILSSGERALFGLAVTLIHDIPRSGLVMLDEPELALHPAMIASLMRLLGLILSAREAFCVVATHSLYVIREVPKDGVHVLKKGKNGVVDYAPMPETLGAGLTELSSVVFDDWKIDEYFKTRIEQVLDSVDTERQVEVIATLQHEIGEAGILAMKQILREDSSRDNQ